MNFLPRRHVPTVQALALTLALLLLPAARSSGQIIYRGFAPGYAGGYYATTTTVGYPYTYGGYGYAPYYGYSGYYAPGFGYGSPYYGGYYSPTVYQAPAFGYYSSAYRGLGVVPGYGLGFGPRYGISNRGFGGLGISIGIGGGRFGGPGFGFPGRRFGGFYR